MEEFNINAGGIISAILVAIVAGFLISPNIDSNGYVKGYAILYIVVIMAGAIGGTFIWERIFPKK